MRRVIINREELEKLVDYYQNQTLAHAYLISTNNIDKCMSILLDVIKKIFCESCSDENNKSSLCHLIDINNLPSLKIIEPDGNFIKKEQIIELKNSFSMGNQYTKENIYIIKNAEKMNKESANTMLKFLEEPSGNVIGFFVTNSKDNIMLTIQSRTQLIDVNFDDNLYDKLNVDEERYNEYIDVLLNYLKSIELENKESIIYNRKYLEKYEKNEIRAIFQIMLNIYQSIFKNNEGFNEFEFLNKFSKDNLFKKINLIIEILNEISYNINVSLILDRFVLEMEGINCESI